MQTYQDLEDEARQNKKDKMENKYIGVLDINKQRNIGDIWTLGEDGVYHCPNYEYTLEPWQVKHDVALGYLKPYRDGKSG